MQRTRFLTTVLLLLLGSMIVACEPTAKIIVPTALPTITLTYTPSPTRTPGRDATPTLRAVSEVFTAGPSPTPLFGATRQPATVIFVTPTRAANPNAPRIEFFTSDVLGVEPGGKVTLYWSARNVDTVLLYRIQQGERSQVFNDLPPDGRLEISTKRSDRGQLDFLLSAGRGSDYIEQTLSIPFQCPIAWFFAPAPEDCPDAEPTETRLTEQTFERGRMVFVQTENLIYVLFNDGQDPAWLSFENRYDPAIHPEKDPNAPPDFIQPLRELGLVWRTNDTVRNRLGLGTAEGVSYDGAVQTFTRPGRSPQIFMNSADGTVLQILAGGETWQIIVPVPTTQEGS